MRRQEKLHATLCSLPDAGAKAPVISERRRRDLPDFGRVDVEVPGVFSGTINVGRLYLRPYPERRHGTNAFQQIQHTLGYRESDLYLVGIYNFTDNLDAVGRSGWKERSSAGGIDRSCASKPITSGCSALRPI